MIVTIHDYSGDERQTTSNVGGEVVKIHDRILVSVDGEEGGARASVRGSVARRR